VTDLSGWHPDPGGARGRFRYWDGQRWSQETTTDPAAPPPVPPNRPRRSRGPLVAAVVGGLVVLLGLGLAVRFVIEAGPLDLDPSPPPTVVPGNDRSPSPTPRATPSPTPRTPSPAATPESAVPLVDCPFGRPGLRSDHPQDGRVHGGNLSFPAEPTYRPADVEARLSMAFDVAQQTLPVASNPDWIAQLAVGKLLSESGFVGDARSTAASLASCIATGSMYSPYRPSRTDVRSGAISISGREGWLVESEIRVDAPGLPFPGDRTIVLVVRDRDDWGFFFGSAPIGNADLGQVLDRTVAALRAT
jgi:hypothetical protein